MQFVFGVKVPPHRPERVAMRPDLEGLILQDLNKFQIWLHMGLHSFRRPTINYGTTALKVNAFLALRAELQNCDHAGRRRRQKGIGRFVLPEYEAVFDPHDLSLSRDRLGSHRDRRRGLPGGPGGRKAPALKGHSRNRRDRPRVTACTQSDLLAPLTMFQTLRMQMDKFAIRPDYKVNGLSSLPNVLSRRASAFAESGR